MRRNQAKDGATRRGASDNAGTLYNSRTVLLGTGLRRIAHLAGFGLVGSGILWLAAHYFMTVQGPFGPEHSPLEAWSLKIHGAFGFLALWLTGGLWGPHMKKAWDQGRRRFSGAMLLLFLLLLIVSGYGLYYLGDEALRAAASLAHWVIGCSLPLVYAMHRLARRN